MTGFRRWLLEHLGSGQVARIIYGSIIGLALVVALQKHPPGAGAVAGLLIGSAVAVGLAELYADIVSEQARFRRRLTRAEIVETIDASVAVFFGAAFPAIFFLLSELGVLKLDTAFTAAKWTGLGLISFYGYCAGRLAGDGHVRALLQALAVGLIGGALIGLKAILH